MPEEIQIHGECHPRFARVREVFRAAFESGAEIGAAVSLLHDGERVVDLWAGWQDAARTRPWERDTIVNVFSTTHKSTSASISLGQLISITTLPGGGASLLHRSRPRG